MARIDELLHRVEDEHLRSALEDEVAQLRNRMEFGIVFERHIPEEVPLAGIPPAPGDRVVGRHWSPSKQPRVVESTDLSGVAILRAPSGASEREQVGELLVLKRLGEDVFPGLRPAEQVVRDPARPWHAVINGENYHALQLLRAGMSGRFDCVYIDPPYNSGKKDWRYNNRFVDSNDRYRHSKWLAMMERRLLLTRDLLKDDGVLTIAIDENEHAHLVLLLEKLFPGYSIVSVAIEHNPRGIQGDNFSYTNDFAVFVYRTVARVPRIARVPRRPDDYLWQALRTWGTDSTRDTARNCFYPVYVKDGAIVGFGDVPEDSFHPHANESTEPGVIAVWPLDRNDTERKWRYSRESVARISREHLRVVERQVGGVRRLDLELLKHDDVVRTVWTGRNGVDGNRYDANHWGSKLLSALLPDERFPFPKSLYSTRDALHAAVGNRPNALILDYFGGSGTTLHATALLNGEDDGNRRCVLVTNNEVGDKSATRLRKRGVYPGDAEWESAGIFNAVTLPRVRAALTGLRSDEHEVNFQYIDGTPVASGLNDNAAFFELEYLDRTEIELDGAMDRLYPLLWLAAEGHGPLSSLEHGALTLDADAGWAIIRRPAAMPRVRKAIAAGVRLTDVWIVSDSDDLFAQTAGQLDGVRVTHLYEELLGRLRVRSGGDR